MRTYYLTVFEKDGNKLLDETFTATNDREAKKLGTNLLTEKGYIEYTHRCVSSEAKLLLFQR